MRKQLDLFKAEVMAFPLERTVDVARMARFLDVVQGDRALLHYVKICKRMNRRLRSIGISPEEARRHVEAYQTAVQTELARLYWQRRSRRPGGAA